MSATACSTVTGLDDLIFDSPAVSSGSGPPSSDECSGEAGTDANNECPGGVCDGLGHCAIGDVAWSHVYASAKRVVAHDIAATGNHFVTVGQFKDEAAFAPSPAPPFSGGAGSAWFVVRDQDGGYITGGSFGDQTTAGIALAAAPDDAGLSVNGVRW